MFLNIMNNMKMCRHQQYQHQLLFLLAVALATSADAYISIVTGANGFVGRHVVYALLQKHYSDPKYKVSPEPTIICLVRPEKVQYEQSFWNAHGNEFQQSRTDEKSLCVKVMPYDMLDNGETLNDAMEAAIKGRSSTSSSACPICVYHIASVFGPTPDPIQTAKGNVQSSEDVIRTLNKFYDRHPNSKLRVVLTSSMAAVRATDQPPLNGKFYTHRDWNTLSELNENNWGSCYQWSKAESERRALELVRECNDRYAKDNDGTGREITMIALCPSFVFGPPCPIPVEKREDATDTTMAGGGSSSYSLTLIGQWLRGNSPVQSRLCADVRDVAKAHLVAGTMTNLPRSDADRRYILSSEVRLSSEATAEALLRGVVRAQEKRGTPCIAIDASKISFDKQFTGGAISIGMRETDASERLEEDLGIVFRSVEETMQDTAEALLSSMQ
jgi:nucleoside-diphosphate-sugar epimerase